MPIHVAIVRIENCRYALAQRVEHHRDVSGNDRVLDYIARQRVEGLIWGNGGYR